MSDNLPADIKITINGTTVNVVAKLEAMTVDVAHTLSGAEVTEANAEYLASYLPRLIANELARRLAEPVRQAIITLIEAREAA